MKTTKVYVLLFFLIFNFSEQVFAKFFVNLEYGTSYDTSNQFPSGRNNQRLYIGEVSLPLSAYSSYFFNTGVLHSVSIAPISNNDTSTFTTDALYAGLKFCFLKDNIFCGDLNYSPFGQSVYSQTGTSIYESWMNSAFVGNVTIRPKISNHLALAFNLYYLSINYSQRKISSGGSGLSSTNSISRVLIIPTLGFEYEF